MRTKLDKQSVTAIVIGMILMIVTDYYMFGYASFPMEWAGQICVVVVVVVSAMHGITAGVIMPSAVAIITGVAFMGTSVFDELLVLLLFGVATGHYMDKLMINEGRFTGIRIFDFIMLEMMLSILAWLCVHPLGSFYMHRMDLRITLEEGVIYCGVSILANLCICLPVLLLFNHIFKKKRVEEDARKAYLRHGDGSFG